jgi:hypothetical protein
LPGIVSSGGRDYSARIQNIAPMGAMVELCAPFTEGTSLILRCGSIEVHAVVVWIRQLRMGIRFTAPVSERQIEEQLSRAAAAASLKTRVSLAAASGNEPGSRSGG